MALRVWNRLALTSFSICVGLAVTPATAGTLHFDELLPRQGVVANGLTVGGVTFNFSFGGSPSAEAIYGTPFPYSDALLQDFVLSGPAVNPFDASIAGALSFTFARPTSVLEFAVALTTSANSFIALTFFDSNGNPLVPAILATMYDAANCHPYLSRVASPKGSLSTCLSEAKFTYRGSVALGRVDLSFLGAQAENFAIDNLVTSLPSTSVPEPSSLYLLLPAALFFSVVPTRRSRLS